MQISRRLILIALAVTALTIALSNWALRHSFKRTDVLSDAFNIINTKYYDKTYNGLDMTAFENRLRKRLVSGEHADQLLAELLRSLQSSHTGYLPSGNIGQFYADASYFYSAPDTYVSTESNFRTSLVKSFARRCVAPKYLTVGDHIELQRFDYTKYSIKILRRDGSVDRHFIVYDRPDISLYPDIDLSDKRKSIIVNRISNASLTEIGMMEGIQQYADYSITYRELCLNASLGKHNRQMYVIHSGAPKGIGPQEGDVVSDFNLSASKSGTRTIIEYISSSGAVKKLTSTERMEEYFSKSNLDLYKHHNGVAWTRISSINEESYNKTYDLVNSLEAGETWVMDLRFCRGGDLSWLKRYMSPILGKGIVIGFSNRGPITADSVPQSVPRESKIVVLVSPATASACEIVADDVQVYEKGTVIGGPTSGRVLLQNKFDLVRGGVLMLPVSDFVDPAGRKIEGYGVTGAACLSTQNGIEKSTRNIICETASRSP